MSEDHIVQDSENHYHLCVPAARTVLSQLCKKSLILTDMFIYHK